jgi:hypothetical protein
MLHFYIPHVAPILQKDFPDIETAGYATTIGPAQFREPLQNKPNIANLTSILRRGAPKAVSIVMSFSLQVLII